jgi:hypothetical protein
VLGLAQRADVCVVLGPASISAELERAGLEVRFVEDGA